MKISLATSITPYAQGLFKGGVHFQLDTESYKTSSIVDVNGDETDLNEGYTYSRYDFDALFRYAIVDNFELWLGGKIRSVWSEYTSDFGDGVESQTFSNSALHSALVGFKFAFGENQSLSYALEGYYRNRLFSNEIYTDGTQPSEISLGDDTREYAVGVDVSFKTKSNNLFETKIHYRSPAEFLAHEFFVKARYALVYQSMALYLGGESVISRNNSAYSEDPANIPQTFQGASAEFNSINRSWTAPFVGLNLKFGENFILHTQYAQDISGKSTSLDKRMLIGISYLSNTASADASAKDGQFKQYRIEGVVTKFSKTRRVVIVDKGVSHGLVLGMPVDFYHFDFVGGNQLIATGIVIKAKASTALIKISKKYSRKRVEEGTVIRADEIR